jgi:hypothetical protein
MLPLLKKSDEGIDVKELVSAGKETGVESPLENTKKLINAGLARIDKGKDGKPTLVKATPKAFGVFE